TILQIPQQRTSRQLQPKSSASSAPNTSSVRHLAPWPTQRCIAGGSRKAESNALCGFRSTPIPYPQPPHSGPTTSRSTRTMSNLPFHTSKTVQQRRAAVAAQAQKRQPQFKVPGRIGAPSDVPKKPEPIPAGAKTVQEGATSEPVVEGSGKGEKRTRPDSIDMSALQAAKSGAAKPPIHTANLRRTVTTSQRLPATTAASKSDVPKKPEPTETTAPGGATRETVESTLQEATSRAPKMPVHIATHLRTSRKSHRPPAPTPAISGSQTDVPKNPEATVVGAERTRREETLAVAQARRVEKRKHPDSMDMSALQAATIVAERTPTRTATASRRPPTPSTAISGSQPDVPKKPGPTPVAERTGRGDATNETRETRETRATRESVTMAQARRVEKRKHPDSMDMSALQAATILVAATPDTATPRRIAKSRRPPAPSVAISDPGSTARHAPHGPSIPAASEEKKITRKSISAALPAPPAPPAAPPRPSRTKPAAEQRQEQESILAVLAHWRAGGKPPTPPPTSESSVPIVWARQRHPSPQRTSGFEDVKQNWGDAYYRGTKD
ncbi:hypothetical protein EDC01DRAFT_747591, partial [Geopyxis carbonaria]